MMNQKKKDDYKSKGIFLEFEDEVKERIVEKAVDTLLDAGFDLRNLRVQCSSESDKNMKNIAYGEENNVEYAGLCVIDQEDFSKKEKILLTHEKNWRKALNAQGEKYPVWKENTFSGEAHYFYHEVGHFLHDMAVLYKERNDELKMDEMFVKDVQEKISKELGWSYPASSELEFVAEMFAAHMGGKIFSPQLEHLYQVYGGAGEDKTLEAFLKKVGKIEQEMPIQEEKRKNDAFNDVISDIAFVREDERGNAFKKIYALIWKQHEALPSFSTLDAVGNVVKQIKELAPFERKEFFETICDDLKNSSVLKRGANVEADQMQEKEKISHRLESCMIEFAKTINLLEKPDLALRQVKKLKEKYENEGILGNEEQKVAIVRNTDMLHKEVCTHIGKSEYEKPLLFSRGKIDSIIIYDGDIQGIKLGELTPKDELFNDASVRIPIGLSKTIESVERSHEILDNILAEKISKAAREILSSSRDVQDRMVEILSLKSTEVVRNIPAKEDLENFLAEAWPPKNRYLDQKDIECRAKKRFGGWGKWKQVSSYEGKFDSVTYIADPQEKYVSFSSEKGSKEFRVSRAKFGNTEFGNFSFQRTDVTRGRDTGGREVQWRVTPRTPMREIERGSSRGRHDVQGR